MENVETCAENYRRWDEKFVKNSKKMEINFYNITTRYYEEFQNIGREVILLHYSKKTNN